jgi:hypothetical protein
MDTRTQDVPGYFVWQVPGKPVAVHLHLGVIDGLLPEIMRGLGAVPKRGAEVGGLLIGTIEPGNPSIVRVNDFECVECAYKRGPSYLFTDEDGPEFEAACKRRQPDASPNAYAVGYFRSHTRDGLSMTPEDIEIMDEFFPDAAQVALLIKPFASKVSQAGFFFRENGLISGGTALEFPFRRRELTGEDSPPRRTLTERAAERGAERAARPRRSRELFPETGGDPGQPIDREQARFDPARFEPVGFGPARFDPARPDPDSGLNAATPRLLRWMWIPVSLLFLLLGAALGFQAAISMGRSGGNAAEEFNLALNVTRTGENLSVKWNPNSPAVRAAQRGVLEIEDGGSAKSVELDSQYLQTGAITYNNMTGTVHFRLVVYVNARSSVVQTLEWRQ